MRYPLIAVIETNPVMSLLLDELLLSEGYRVCLWPSQEGVVAFIHDQRPDLIILDLWLQHGDDGAKVLRQLGNDAITRHIPMLICSGEPEMLPREALHGLARYDVLAKPFVLDDFTERLCERTGLLISQSMVEIKDHTLATRAIIQSA